MMPTTDKPGAKTPTPVRPKMPTTDKPTTATGKTKSAKQKLAEGFRILGLVPEAKEVDLPQESRDVFEGSILKQFADKTGKIPAQSFDAATLALKTAYRRLKASEQHAMGKDGIALPRQFSQ